MREGRAAVTSVKLELPSEVRLIDLVHCASEKMAEVAGMDADTALNVGLAVREAVINAIVHGNRQDPSLKVDVTLSTDGERLEARIRDRGEGFDPQGTADPTAEANLLRTSGRGLLLIRAFVDEVEIKPAKDRGMQVTLIKRLEPRAGQASDDDESEDTEDETNGES